jgi:hypothetical protein
MFINEWETIRTIECQKFSNGLAPYRLRLVRSDSIVTAAGWSWTEAAVALLSTAELGRFTPYGLSRIVMNKLGTNLDDGIQNFLSLVDSERNKFKYC